MPKLVGSDHNQVPMNSMLGGMAFQDVTSYFRAVQGTAVASTSGTSIDFTGLPVWVKRVTVMFSGVSTNGASDVQIQVGAGSITASGYLGDSSNLSGGVGTGAYTAGFGINSGGATVLRHGIFTISTLGSNIWAASGNIGISGLGDYMVVSAGTVTLSGTLDRVRITTVNGTDTFDAGSVNILYEG
jgi:hypothetical protein